MRRVFVLVLFSCALGAATAAAGASAASPLVAQWPLDGATTSGGTEFTEDVSGNGLSLSGPANTMKFGTAEAKFGGYMTGATTTPPQVTSPLLAQQQLTLLAWIKQSGYPGTLRYIAGRGNDGPTCSGSSYALYSGYTAVAGLHFYVRQPGPEAPGVLSDSPPDSAVFDGKWHLVAGTFDGSAIHLYVDGNEVGTPKPASGISYEAPITDQSFYVDGYPPQALCSGISEFPGQIDEVRVYDRALSAAELGRLAAAPGPVPPVLEPDAGAQPGPGPAPQPVGPAPGRLGVSLSRTGPAAEISNSRITLLKLDTSGPVNETKIKLDGKPAFTVPADTKFVGLNLGQLGQHVITATALGIGGATASASTGVNVKASPGSSGGVLTRPKFLPDSGFFTPAEEVDTLVEALKNSQCVPNSTVVFGVMEATGCFRKILPTPEELPRGERAAGEEYLATQTLLETHAPKICRVEDPTCHTNFVDALKKDPALQPFVASGKVQMDGLTIEPIGGATVLVFPAIKRVISSNARMYFDGGVLGKVPVHPAGMPDTGELNLDLSTNAKYFTSGDAELSLFSFDTSQAFDDIGGFPINGTVGISFQKRSGSYFTSLKVNLSLPEEITTAAGANPTAKVELNASNARGTYL
ncbi:MAG TPA: LamG domain-containing protein, partial [Solirubrobacterales bacterium]